MKKTKVKNKRRTKALKKANLILIFIFSIAIVLVLIELNLVVKKKNELPARTSINTKEFIDNLKNDNEKTYKINEGLSFDTFVDRVYTEDDIIDFSSDEIGRVRREQIDQKNHSSLTVKKVVGSASSENIATRIATQACVADDQFIRSSKVILETDIYYIVKVEWEYISESVSRTQNQEVLVFKEFYYDMDSNILNTDDINKVKDILDLKYYVDTYSNTSKNLIQSFIRKNGETCEYVVYYFDVEYEEEGTSNIIYLMVDVLQINSATGLIENVQTNQINDGIRL